MPNLKEVRNRISSVNSTRQITSAMKLVSAAKLRRAQDAVLKMRPYAEKLQAIMNNVSQSLEGAESPYLVERELRTVTLVLVTSNRGLCGAFNTQVIRRTTALLNGELAALHQAGKVKFVGIGKKASAWIVRNGFELQAQHDELFNNLTFSESVKISESLMQEYKNGQTDKVIFIYNRFLTAASQQVMEETFLPMRPQVQEQEASAEYIYEPGKAEIIENMIPLSLKTQLFKVVLDSHAAEHGARMTAMHKATDNAGELLKSLKLSYNKARQAAITNEILEIVAGAEALNG
ncbi:MAG: ATP synthase F1 subunit gamma [Bacteroidetes bacterium]|jgi:F-type H+-transporting ATPase subunit gamma|nr:ATP synthase F1 subunit gamma [Bacteroidota bacterium]